MADSGVGNNAKAKGVGVKGSRKLCGMEPIYVRRCCVSHSLFRGERDTFGKMVRAAAINRWQVEYKSGGHKK